MVLSDMKKMEIIVKYNEGDSMRTIANHMNIDKNTVYKWIQRYRINKNTNRQRGSGLYKKHKI